MIRLLLLLLISSAWAQQQGEPGAPPINIIPPGPGIYVPTVKSYDPHEKISTTSLTSPSFTAGPILSNPPYPGGPLGSSSIATGTDSSFDGTVNIWHMHPWGWGGAAAGLCVIQGIAFPNPVGGSAGNCPVSGGFGSGVAGQTNGSGPALYTERDTVGAVFQNYSGPALFGSVTGTFATTTFVPTVALNTTQLANLRIGMVLDTNDSPTPYSGLISSWAPDGTSINVQGWFLQGCTSPCTGGVPVGTAAKISPVTKAFGANILNARNAATEATTATAIEVDCFNQTGVDDTNFDDSTAPYDGCVDSSNNSANRSSYAFLARGKFVGGLVLDSDSTYGIAINPLGSSNVGVALSVKPATGSGSVTEVLRSWTAGGDYLTRLVYATSVLEMGRQHTSATSPAIRFWTSASGSNNGTNYDSAITPSGGTGSQNGTLTLNAAKVVTTATQVSISVVASLPTCNSAAEGTMMGVSDANSTTYNATAAGAGTNHMPVYCNGTNWVLH